MVLKTNHKQSETNCELLIKYVVNLFSNVGSKTKKFSVYPMQCSFKEVPFAGILGIKQIQ